MNTGSILRSKKKDNEVLTKETVVKQYPKEKKTDSTDVDYCSPWVEKYKPDSTKKIIGQQGDKSNVNKLKFWLTNWYKNNAGNKKPKFVPSKFLFSCEVVKFFPIFIKISVLRWLE